MPPCGARRLDARHRRPAEYQPQDRLCPARQYLRKAEGVLAGRADPMLWHRVMPDAAEARSGICRNVSLASNPGAIPGWTPWNSSPGLAQRNTADPSGEATGSKSDSDG